MTYLEKLSAIRTQMQADNVDAYIIPSADPHISEYLPAHFKCIPFISGFTGSVSTIVITADFAGLWTDSRYFEQAEAQLEGSGFTLVKLKAQGVAEYITWLGNKLEKGATIAFDEQLLSIFLAQSLQQELALQAIRFKHADYLSSIWSDRPELPKNKAFLISETYTGQSTSSKLAAVRKELQQKRADAHLISTLDDLAWLFNIRGTDVAYNPIVLGFSLITMDKAYLYIDKDKLSLEEQTTLANAGVTILAYHSVADDLQFLPKDSNILIDPKKNCYALFKLIPKAVNIISAPNPTTLLKASKNSIEVSNIRTAMIKDGVAITKFLKWINDQIGKIEITEISAAAQLKLFRSEQQGFISESFNTIAAYGAHGALPHYGATAQSDVKVEAKGLFLVDSGGQYKDGTTDITRVIPMGQNTEEEAIDYTLVLKAMINGCRTRFPQGTCGYQIDAITRQAMWEHGLNYGHGTGHGVGFFLNVHEGPQIFNASATPVPIKLGMVTSIEPGLYRPTKHGIRIENLVLTITDQSNEFNTFYAFETLTLAPIDTSLVKKELLEQVQVDWLNAYHENVFAKLSPFLDEDHRTFLAKMTSRL